MPPYIPCKLINIDVSELSYRLKILLVVSVFPVVLLHCRSQNPSEQFAFKTIHEIFTGFLIQSEAFLWDSFGKPMPSLESGRPGYSF
jgi:hypothetical protein